MVKRLFMLALCAGFVTGPWAAMAQPEPTGMEDRIAVEEKKIEEAAGISPEQHQKIQVLVRESKEKQRALNESLQEKKAALKDELEVDGNIDRKKVDGLVADIKSLQGQMLDNRVEQTIKMREVLTNEQYAKLREVHNERKAERGMWGKTRGRMGDRKMESGY